ncbi:MDR family MFS transporter [Dactylosporangium fulvum]|uniref:DHA2 family efflux MFS transporter permease subunit n=1 Tax=Dactylosporangium fulvum TaxID=53359 RepID=A0ABY5W3E0_9ACTN|nr:DHA2 family efflux MFS transporter permease subunit [Dactylosporangium fulvum]UWP84528.1 DHA2 family efflux MFS transporter permease subunit [Dactylosporangium fulvum]
MSGTPTVPRLDRAVLKLSAVVVAGTITAMLDMTMVTVALAGMTRAFQTSIATVQWVNTAYLLSIALVIPLTGRLAERFGTRTMWLFALTVFMTGSALCGAAWSVGSLITFRVAQGIGGGMIVPLSIMILVHAAGPERRGRVMAIAAVPTQLAPIVGPLLGGLIVDSVGWRWIFYLNVPVALLALAVSYRGIPDDGRREVRRLDLPGLALLSPAIALLIFGLSRTGTSGHGLVPLAAGVVLLVAFVVYALRTSEAPVIDLRLFTHRALAAASALNFVSRLSIFGALLLIPLYYQQVRGHSALTAGMLLAPQSLGTMLALPHVGKLTDRIGARPVVLTGIAVTTLGAIAYTQVTSHTHALVLAASLLLWGIGIAAVAVPVSAAAYQGLPPTAIPSATSAITMVQTIGASVGAAVLAAILQHRAAHQPGALAAAFAGTFWWVLGFTALAVVPALFLPMRPATPAGPAGTIRKSVKSSGS